MRRPTFLILAALMVSAASASADEFQDDLKARRARVLEQLGPDAMLVLFSASPKVYSNDVEYEFRQDSTLHYLTGVEQEDTVLVLMPGNRTRQAVLFVRPPDARREHWTGHLLTKAEATARSGIETIYYTNEFEPFVNAMLDRRPYGFRSRDPEAREEFMRFFAALREGRARVALLLQPRPGLSGPLGRAHEFARQLRDRFFGITVTDATDMLWGLRQVKTPYEQRVLARSVEISSEAQRAGMRAARPGAYEYEVESAIEAVYLKNGAMTPGYPSIVGSGPNATILHYSQSSRRMEAGDLLLVDAAGSYQYLTGDITRTYPVGGAFSPVQKEIYGLVLAAQEAAMLAARAGNRTRDVEAASEKVIKAGLLKLGLITDASGDQFRTWYTHGICHFIGMDVHDVGDYERPLEPGMAFVIEPGLYIREAALENLEPTPQNREFIEKVRPAVQKYKDIGVRIEDSFLLTRDGLTRLSATVPRTIDEIESFMRGSPTSTRQRE
jgi:Xaa-Pro aminopeptidase